MPPPPDIDGSKQCEAVFSTEFEQWWDQQDANVQDKLHAWIELVEAAGHRLNEPYTKWIEGYGGKILPGPKELRREISRNPYRLIYVIKDGEAIFLAGDYKTGTEDRFVRVLIQRAERAYTAHLAEVEAEKKAAAARKPGKRKE